MSPKDDILLQIFSRAPAPVRDYYGITVSNDYVILNIWNISYGPHVFPKRYKRDIQEFLDDKELQYNVSNTFGTYVRDFVMGLARKEYNLQYLPTKIFLKILKKLAVRDILNLSQTSKIFFQLCNNDSVWKMICLKQPKQTFTRQELLKTQDGGWKQLMQEKAIERQKGIGSLNNRNNKLSETRNANIDIITNVKANARIEIVKNVQIKKNELKTYNKKNNSIEGNGKHVILDTNIKLSGKKENDNYKSVSARSVQSTTMLEKKNIVDTTKVRSKAINSVTDIINVVSKAPIKSSNNIRNKSATKKLNK